MQARQGKNVCGGVSLQAGRQAAVVPCATLANPQVEQWCGAAGMGLWKDIRVEAVSLVSLV